MTGKILGPLMSVIIFPTGQGYLPTNAASVSKRASGNLKNKGVVEYRLHEQSPTSIVRMIFEGNVLRFLLS